VLAVADGDYIRAATIMPARRTLPTATLAHFKILDIIIESSFGTRARRQFLIISFA
jgi:hypothetical protein